MYPNVICKISGKSIANYCKNEVVTVLVRIKPDIFKLRFQLKI